MGKGKGKGKGELSFSELMKLGQQTLTKLKDEGERSIVTEFLEEWKKVKGQIEAVEDLSKNIELPKDVEAKIAKIKTDMRKFYKFVEAKYGLDGGRALSWLTYVQIFKPVVVAIGPYTFVYFSRNGYLLLYLLGFALIIFLIWTTNQHQIVIEFINAWRGTHDSELEKYMKKLRKFYDTLRDFAALQNQLRKARTFDVRSILEENKGARDFWIRHFGASTHSVPSSQMIDALLHSNKQTHLVGKQTIDVIYNTIAKIIDKNGDGVISAIEILDFLKYFGPIDKCVDRIKSSLIDERSNEGSRLYPWFTWRSKDRIELEKLMKRYATDGDFVVRCSSQGGFAVTVWKEGYKIPSHMRVYYVPETKASPDGRVRPFYIEEGGGKAKKFFQSLAELVSARKSDLKQAFMDPETVAYFSISGTPFTVQASLFMGKRDCDTYLGRYFDPSVDSSSGFPRGEFWNHSQVGHSKKDPIFMDRNPAAFNVILNWYRYGGKLYVPEGISRILMEREIKFFRLPIECIHERERGMLKISFKAASK